jgi:quercetin dioxygenase-like cupin family protein
VAAAAGVTKGFLSEVERGLTAPSVATLLRLCRTLNIEIAQLFEGDGRALIRAAERSPVEFGGQGVTEYQLTPAGERRVLVLMSEIAPGGGSGEEDYVLDADVEVAHVLDGTLDVDLDGTRHRLSSGDSLTFESRTPHRWRNPSSALPTRVMWVLVPALG